MEQNQELSVEQVVAKNNQLSTQLNIQVATNQKIQKVVGEYVSKYASLEVSFEHMKQYAESLEQKIADYEKEEAKPKRVYPAKPKSEKAK